MVKFKDIKIKLAGLVISLLLITVLGVVAWLQPLPAHSAALNIIANSSEVTVTSDTIAFIPADPITDTGVIIYPGGKVDARAYAPICQSLLYSGHTCVIAIMPLNLAFTNLNAATAITAEHPRVKNWVLIGHSLGGAMGVRYIQANPTVFKGLILMGAYADVDISQLNLKVKSYFGSLDTVFERSTWENTRTNLPAKTDYIEIPGGNHAGYAYYGPQPGDGEATISPDQQISILSSGIIEMLNTL